MLQAQIFESAKENPVPFEKYTEFAIEPLLPTDEGGFMESIPDHVLRNETLDDTNLRDYILSGQVPTVHTIFRFGIENDESFRAYYVVSSCIYVAWTVHSPNLYIHCPINL